MKGGGGVSFRGKTSTETKIFRYQPNINASEVIFGKGDVGLMSRTSDDPRIYPTSLNPLPPPASPLPHVYTRTSIHLPSLCDKTSLLFPISPLTTRQQSSTAHQRVTLERYIATQ